MNQSRLTPFVTTEQPIARVRSAPAVEDLPSVEGLLAGAAEVDITPPPGLPRSGHSRNAHNGSGFRTRLRARVVHLRSGTTSVALVASDLLGGSAVLTHLVAEAIAQDTDVRLPGLFMGFTHTHSGPGQFNGCDFYNTWASNKPGFDPAWTDFLVRRISGAIREAVANRAPARLATGSTEVWGVTRNRSLDAYVRNATVNERLERHRAYAAVNPWLHLLRVDSVTNDGGHTPLAALSVFSIHGTGISPSDKFYNADVWAYLNDELAHRVERSTGARPITGAIEGTHGDVTPAVTPGQLVYPQAERVGRTIGVAAADLHERLASELTDQVELSAGVREIDLTTQPEIDGITLPEPAVGIAKLAGARENQTAVISRLPPFAPGHPNKRGTGPHGPKRQIATQKLRELFGASSSGLPRVLPLEVIRIGSMLIAGVPFETCVESGRRIEQAIHDAIGDGAGIGRVVVSSLVNDHWDYLTTAEEYAQQCYEGASVIYGAGSQRFVAAAAAELAAEVIKAGAVAQHLPERSFALRTHRYLTRPTGKPVARTALGAPAFTEATVDSEAYWELRWRDVAPADLHWHEPLLRVETSIGDGPWEPTIREGRPVDDQGWWVGVLHLSKDRAGGHRYAARWYGPDLAADRKHRFVFPANAGQPEYASEPFD